MLETSVSDELSSSEKEVSNTEDVENKIKVITAMGQSKIIDLFLKGLILILKRWCQVPAGTFCNRIS